MKLYELKTLIEKLEKEYVPIMLSSSYLARETSISLDICIKELKAIYSYELFGKKIDPFDIVHPIQFDLVE